MSRHRDHNCRGWNQIHSSDFVFRYFLCNCMKIFIKEFFLWTQKDVPLPKYIFNDWVNCLMIILKKISLYLFHIHSAQRWLDYKICDSVSRTRDERTFSVQCKHNNEDREEKFGSLLWHHGMSHLLMTLFADGKNQTMMSVQGLIRLFLP